MNLYEFVFADIITLIVIIAASVYIYYKWSFNYWKRHGVEQTEATIPFGSASQMIRQKKTFGGQLREVYDEYKTKGLRYVGFYLFTQPTLVVIDISLIRAILTEDFHHFTDHGNYVNEEQEPLTGTVFALKGQKWKHLRAKLTPTFTSGKMKMMFNTLVDCSKGLKDVMDDYVHKNEAVEIKDVVARYTTDVIGSCAFGIDCNSLKDPNSEFRKIGRQIFDSTPYESIVRFLALVAPKVVSTLRLRFIGKTVTDFIMNLVGKTIEYREANNVKRNDFMHLLIQLKNNIQIKDDEDIEHLKNEHSSSDGLTVEEIAAQALVFFAAGFETSSTTLTFCFYELVTNHDIQKKLREEVQTVLRKHNGEITYQALSEMTYMDKCIQETLRKYPPLPLLFRECTEDYVIPDSNLCIKKGTRLFIPVLGVHHDSEFYPNPEQFDPERFSVENKANRDHFAWLPFGEGPRACIGLRFGLMQTKVALAALIKDYEFSLNHKTETPLSMSNESLILSVEGGVWLNVKQL